MTYKKRGVTNVAIFYLTDQHLLITRQSLPE